MLQKLAQSKGNKNFRFKKIHKTKVSLLKRQSNKFQKGQDPK